MAALAHVLILPYPMQGHINPMLQFAKRLVSKGVQATLVTTHFLINSVSSAVIEGVRYAGISDGFDDGGVDAAPNLEAYFASLEFIGARTLSELLDSENFTCIVYDTFVPWAVKVAKERGIPVAAFSTQSCAVSSIYHHVNIGELEVPKDDGNGGATAGLPPLARSDFPSFVFQNGSYPTLTRLSLNQFSSGDVDWVLFNSFDELESKVMAVLRGYWRARTVGPTVPSMLLDKRVNGDDNYSMNLLHPEFDVCKTWLDGKWPNSVVYVSFGSFASLSEEQMSELAGALVATKKPFLWVVRSTEQQRMSPHFTSALALAAAQEGLVVGWSPQLAVLVHESVGCFVTHCGWNSTLEAVALGVPMVALPQWTDQPTNAKFVEDVWGVGVRARVEKKSGVVRTGDIERCIREVMEGEKAAEIRRNCRWWRSAAMEALGDGGSSDENIIEFVEYLNEKANEKV